MYYLYILKSLKDSGYYIGSCENITIRLDRHNKGRVRSTKSRVPFELKYQEEYTTKKEARQRENLLKKNFQARKELLEKIDFYKAPSSNG